MEDTLTKQPKVDFNLDGDVDQEDSQFNELKHSQFNELKLGQRKDSACSSNQDLKEPSH